jgi:predicted AlkP superfamily phosphohydrolase/phosphomutase
VHIGGFDNACHAFWQYRFPEDFPADPPDAGDVKNYGPVIDRYLEFIDKRLAKLLAAFPVRPNVIIVSDHGHGPIDTATLWRGHHASPGLFIAAGPDVLKSSEILKVSYYDIVPTILDLTGFMKADGLRGRSVVTAGH